ncbi:MAG: cupin domain-containing protein [Mesorhizobium sp.]
MEKPEREPVVLEVGAGRTYQMPGMRAVFKADGAETRSRYSISEWWLDGETDGPGAHSHDGNDEIFYGIGGTMSVLVGETWCELPEGGCIVIPAGTMHDFANRTNRPAGLLNVFTEDGFEEKMPSIVRWFKDNQKE